MATRSRKSTPKANRKGNLEKRSKHNDYETSANSDGASDSTESDEYHDPSALNRTHRRPKGTKSGKFKDKSMSKPKSKKALYLEGVAARKQCKELKQQIEQQAKDINELMDQIVEFRTQSQRLVIDGQQLQTDAAGMQHQWRCWAIDHGIEGPLLKIEDQDELNAICQLAESRAATKSDGGKIKGLPVGGSVLLQAILTDFIDKKLFQRPYFFLGREAGGETALLVEEGFMAVDKLVLTGSDVGRQALLRAKITEYLNPDLDSQLGLDRPKSALSVIMNDHKEDFYHVQASKFIAKWSNTLLRSSSPRQEMQRRNELVAVFRKADHLSLQLRTQNVRLEFCLPRSPPYWQTTYTSSSNVLELHSTVNVGEQTLSLDGKPIQFVVEPVLVGIKAGEMEAGQRLERKVFGKAVVWLEAARVPSENKAATKQTIIDLSECEEGIAPRQLILETTSFDRRDCDSSLITYESKILSDTHLQNTDMKQDSRELNREWSCSTEVMQKAEPLDLGRPPGVEDAGYLAVSIPTDKCQEQVQPGQGGPPSTTMEKVEILSQASQMQTKRKASLKDSNSISGGDGHRRRVHREEAVSW